MTTFARRPTRWSDLNCSFLGFSSSRSIGVDFTGYDQDFSDQSRATDNEASLGCACLFSSSINAISVTSLGVAQIHNQAKMPSLCEHTANEIVPRTKAPHGCILRGLPLKTRTLSPSKTKLGNMSRKRMPEHPCEQLVENLSVQK